MISRADAKTWAPWFAALGDPTRVLILNVLAEAEEPLTVGQLVDAIDVGQSTVSHHLRRLAEVGFVRLTRAGTSTTCEVNRRCMSGFPSAADIIMGNVPRGSSLEEVCGARR
jgi:DNA-binding transcriptional ArsR family regulator